MSETPAQQDAPEAASAFNLCPVGFLVHQDGLVDTARGCGHRKCYPSACEIVKRLEAE